jgi:hypothetical protein
LNVVAKVRHRGQSVPPHGLFGFTAFRGKAHGPGGRRWVGAVVSDHTDPGPHKRWDTAEVVDAFRTTWALFTVIEAQDQDRSTTSSRQQMTGY